MNYTFGCEQISRCVVPLPCIVYDRDSMSLLRRYSTFGSGISLTVARILAWSVLFVPVNYNFAHSNSSFTPSAHNGSAFNIPGTALFVICS